MPTSTITSKGQTTLPRAVREALKVGAGDRVVYDIVGETVRIRSARATVDDLYGILHEDGMREVDLEEAREAFRQEAARQATGTDTE